MSRFAGVINAAAGARARVLGWLCAPVLMFAVSNPCDAGWESYAGAAGPLVAVLFVLLAERLGQTSEPVTFELEGDTISWTTKRLRVADICSWAEVNHNGRVVFVITTLLDETWWLLLDEGPFASAVRAWLSPANHRGQLRLEESSMTPRSVGLAAVAPILLAAAVHFFGAQKGRHEFLFFGLIALLLTSFGCCFVVLGAALRRVALTFDGATILVPGPVLLEKVRVSASAQRRLLLEVDGARRRVWLARVLNRAVRRQLDLDETGVCLRILQGRIEAIQSTERGAFR